MNDDPLLTTAFYVTAAIMFLAFWVLPAVIIFAVVHWKKKKQAKKPYEKHP